MLRVANLGIKEIIPVKSKNTELVVEPLRALRTERYTAALYIDTVICNFGL